MPKASATTAKQPKPVTVTLRRIEAYRPCWYDYCRFLKRVGGVPSKRYVDGSLDIGGCQCDECVEIRERDSKSMNRQIASMREKAKVNAATPIPVKSIEKMNRAWSSWVVNLVLNSTEKKRWYAQK